MHSTGIIEYAVDTNEIESCKLEIEVIHDQVSSVTIEARDSQLILRFHTIGVFPEDNESAMNDLASRCFTYLAHTYGFSIRNMRRGGSTLPQRNGKLSTVINAFGLSWNIEAPKKSLDNAVQSTIQKSIGIIELDIQLIHEFVIARSEIDKVSRFMFLYNLALQMHGDNQKTLDESILRLESRCSVSRSLSDLPTIIG